MKIKFRDFETLYNFPALPFCLPCWESICQNNKCFKMKDSGKHFFSFYNAKNLKLI